MDDTQQSRVSDAAAAATRKRRSSILKSQRPARTPFSELEFNVATPTDTAKSRRVSFSRRTGVAEFVTNEATTTWKNFYEEHNKSLESSSNDSEANASRQPVGHLGKRIFDQQFEEVEAVDFISGIANGSINNVNFSQQMASLECTGEAKLTAPHNKFELSAFTEQSKLFGNDFTAPSIGDNSGRIDVNFSLIQQVEKDDLDEIEKDLERGTNNMGCHGPFSDRQNMSEYIEVDLNMTHVVKNDEDMSITDTVHSPVQDVSKSASIDKKVTLNNDWVADKENIAINPYAAPCESNFAVNEEPDQVLVFDGKRLTLQPDKPEKDKNYRQTLLPNSSAETPQRKTIVLNVNDDLPNFIDDMLSSKCENSGINGFQEIKTNEDEISDTLPVNRVEIKPKRRTFHDNTGNISMTQALPTNIICQAAVITHDANATKRRTIVFNESTSNMSVTEAVPVKLLSSSGTLPDGRRTMDYEDDTANISFTQAVPSNILVNGNSESNNKHKTILDSDEDSVSASSSKVLDENAGKRKTIVFDDDTCDVSFTQALPVNIMLPDKQSQEKRRTIIYENDTGDISVTQALPTNVILPNNKQNPERRRTVVYDDDAGNISVTQALPSNILTENIQLDATKEKIKEDSLPTLAFTNITVKDSDSSRRRTIVYENDAGNISITQAIPSQLIPGIGEDKAIDPFNTSRKPRNKKRTTIVYDNDEGDVSMTEAISANIIEEATNLGKTCVFDENEANISMTLAISTNIFLLDNVDSTDDQIVKQNENKKEKKKESFNFDVYEQNCPQAQVDASLEHRKSSVLNADIGHSNMTQEKLKSAIFDNDSGDIQLTKPMLTELITFGPEMLNKSSELQMTKPIPAELITFGSETLNESKSKVLELTDIESIACPQSDVIVLQTLNSNSKPTSQANSTEQGDIRNADNYRNTTCDSKVASSINVSDDGVHSPVEDVSANASLLHPRVEEKIPQLNLLSSDIVLADKVSEGEDDAVTQTNDELKRKSLINMIDTITDSDASDKNIMVQLKSNSPCATKKVEIDDNSSKESMFHIIKDCENDTHTGNESKTANATKLKNTEEVESIDDLQMKLAELQTSVSRKHDLSKSRLLDKIGYSDLEDVVEDDKNAKKGHEYKKADSTQELIDMISNITDNKDTDGDVEPIAVKVKSQDISQHNRRSVAPHRQSIALSREDLLNNISMAQAALQKSRLALDDSNSPEEDTRDAPVGMSSLKPTRASNEVVKTLQFDDESISEFSLKSDEKYSPLKKTAFGETSYMHESKGNVIPTYLKDVSDGLKELMLDLVKPMSDNMPFESALVDKGVPKIPSMQSTPVQANLFASSQIDLHSESGPNTYSDIDKMSSLTSSVLSSKSRSRCLKSPVKFSTDLDEPTETNFYPCPYKLVEQTPVPEVVFFDHLNPLNNILLPLNNTEVHRYDPKKPEEKNEEERLDVPHHSRSTFAVQFDYTSEGNDVGTVTTTQYCMEPKAIPSNHFISTPKISHNMQQISTPKISHNMQQDVSDLKKGVQISTRASSCKPGFVDQSIDASTALCKDGEVNTLIAMKANKELLDASSSLTLVDDALDGESRPDTEVQTDHRKIKFKELPPIVKKRAVDIENINKLSDISLQEQFEISTSNTKITKGKKRFFSALADVYRRHHSAEVTPKPISKMQKLSNSPKPQMVTALSSTAESTCNMTPEKDVTDSEKNLTDQNECNSKTCEKVSPKDAKPGHTITVNQLIADYKTLDTELHNNESFKKLGHLNPTSKSFTTFSQSDSSFTSSNNLKAMKDVHSTSTTQCLSPPQSTMQGTASQMDWHSDEMCTSSNPSNTDSGVNVVAKIDMLPFMGSHECEWESSSVDTWTFRLLHGRLRLSARLAHRHDNSTRTRVRADTPVLDIAVDTVQIDRNNPVAALCVRFACETMRYLVTRAMRTSCCARDVPPLLRRCASVARVALRWGRAMHDAKLHLAYTLDNDGNLSLKVANIPLRSVWEVTMRVELVLDDARGVPAPRACGVRVARVVSDVRVRDLDVQRALAATPRDWGHAPRTIWRMFRFLKHKTRDDELLLA